MKTKLVYGILGFVLGGLISFFAFTPQSDLVENSEGSVGVACPRVVYAVGQTIYSECDLQVGATYTFEDRSGCEYIMRNVGSMEIKAGDEIQIMFLTVTRGGTTFMGVEIPLII